MSNNAGRNRGPDIVARLKDFSEAIKGQDTIPERFTRRTVRLRIEPMKIDAKLVKKAREILGTSQAIFAQFIGASPSAVRAWEQDVRPPKGTACRIIEEILTRPAYWSERLAEMAHAVPGNEEDLQNA